MGAATPACWFMGLTRRRPPKLEVVEQRCRRSQVATGTETMRPNLVPVPRRAATRADTDVLGRTSDELRHVVVFARGTTPRQVIRHHRHALFTPDLPCCLYPSLSRSRPRRRPRPSACCVPEVPMQSPSARRSTAYRHGEAHGPPPHSDSRSEQRRGRASHHRGAQPPMSWPPRSTVRRASRVPPSRPLRGQARRSP